MEPHLIQSAQFKHPEKSEENNLDSYVRWNYMGSAEYEFGALGDAWRKLKGSFNELKFSSILLNNKQVTILCSPELEKEITEIVVNLSKDRYAYRLKEYIGFHDAINDTESYSKEEFWFDIDNNYLFWVGEADFEKILTNLIAK